MLIILEGLDATGKSTIARRLHNEYKFDVIHRGPPTKPAVQEYTDLDDYVLGCSNVVCDRWHVGELVYPASRGRSTDLTDEGFATIEQYLVDLGAILVYTIASPDLQRSIMANRGEPFDSNQIALERLLFERALAKSRLPRLNACLDRALYEGVRDLTRILDLAYTWERNATRC